MTMSKILPSRPRRMKTPDMSAGWGGSHRTKVLLECPPEDSPWMIASILERAELDVVVCEGPRAHERCPLAMGGACPAARSAEVIVNMLRGSTPGRAEVLPAVLDSGVAPASVVVMVDDPTEAPQGARPVRRVVGARRLVEEIRQASLSSPRSGCC